MIRETLTKRQAEILDLIRSYVSEEGCPPTRAEIAATLGFRSANAAEDHLRALERKCVIELVTGTSRGIRLVEQTQARARRLQAANEVTRTSTSISPLESRVRMRSAVRAIVVGSCCVTPGRRFCGDRNDPRDRSVRSAHPEYSHARCRQPAGS